MFRISKFIRSSIIIYQSSTVKVSDRTNKNKSFKVISNLRYVPMPNIASAIQQQILLLKDSMTIVSQKDYLSNEDKSGINSLITEVTSSMKQYNYDDLIKFLETYNAKPKHYKISHHIVDSLVTEIQNLFLTLCKQNKISKQGLIIFLRQFHVNFFIQNPSEFFNVVKNVFVNNFDTNDYLLFIECFSTISDKLNLKLKFQLLQFINIQNNIIPWSNLYFINLISSFQFELVPNSFKSPLNYSKSLEKIIQSIYSLSITDQICVLNTFQYQIYNKYEYRPQIKKIIDHLTKNLPLDINTNLLNQFLEVLNIFHKERYQIIGDSSQLFRKIQKIMVNLDESIESCKCFNNILQYINAYEISGSRSQTQNIKVLLISKIMHSKQKPRHYLRILQYFISIDYRKQDLIKTIKNIQIHTEELSVIELLRLWGCKKSLNILQKSDKVTIQFDKMMKSNPSKIIQSLNRNYLVQKNLQTTKIAIDNTIKNIRDKSYMYQLSNAIFSSFHISQIKEYWIKSKQFMQIMKQQYFLLHCYNFIRNVYPFISSRHIEILYFIFKYQIKFRKEFCFNIFKLFDLYQVRRSFKQLPLLLQFFFIKDIIISPEISNIYLNTKLSIIKQAYINNKYCYETENFIEYCFYELIKNDPEDNILFFFIEQFNLQFIRNIKQKYLKRYQLMNRNNNQLPILAKKLEIIHTLKSKNQLNVEEYESIIQQYQKNIAQNPKLSFLALSSSKSEIPSTISQQQLLMLVNPSLSSANWDNIVKYLCYSNYKISRIEFLHLLKQFNNETKTTIILNFLIQKLNQVYEEMNQPQKIRTLIYFSEWRYPLQEILIQQLSKSQSISLIYPIFNLGYIKNDIDLYLQRVVDKKILVPNMYILTLNQKIKLVSTFLSILILRNAPQLKHQIKILLQIIMAQSLENIIDTRFLVCIEILIKKYPQYSSQCQKIKSSISKFKAVFEYYLMNQIKFQKNIFDINKLSESQFTLIDDLYLKKKQKIYIFTPKDCMILGKKNQFSGDFLLYLQYLKIFKLNNTNQIHKIIVDRNWTKQQITKCVSHIVN